MSRLSGSLPHMSVCRDGLGRDDRSLHSPWSPDPGSGSPTSAKLATRHERVACMTRQPIPAIQSSRRMSGRPRNSLFRRSAYPGQHVIKPNFDEIICRRVRRAGRFDTEGPRAVVAKISGSEIGPARASEVGQCRCDEYASSGNPFRVEQVQ